MSIWNLYVAEGLSSWLGTMLPGSHRYRDLGQAVSYVKWRWKWNTYLMGLLFCLRVQVTSLSLAAWPSSLGLIWEWLTMPSLGATLSHTCLLPPCAIYLSISFLHLHWNPFHKLLDSFLPIVVSICVRKVRGGAGQGAPADCVKPLTWCLARSS